MFGGIQRSVLLSGILLVLTACGGGGGGGGNNTPTVVQGRFIDAAVEGLQYSSGTQSGITDANGTFRI